MKSYPSLVQLVLMVLLPATPILAQDALSKTVAQQGDLSRAEVDTSPKPNDFVTADKIHRTLKPWCYQCIHRIESMQKEHYPEGIKDCYCCFHVKRDGDIQDLFVYKSSGSTKMDQMVMQTIKKAVPFPQPPAKLSEKFRILIVFSANNPSINMLVDNTYPIAVEP